MTRTEAIAQAIREELLSIAGNINTSKTLRGIVFDVRMVPGTDIVRAVIVRPEYESTRPNHYQNGSQKIG